MKRLFTVVIALLMIFAVFSPMTSFASSQHEATIINGTFDVTAYLENTKKPLPTGTQIAIQNYILECTNEVPEHLDVYRFLMAIKVSREFGISYEDAMAFMRCHTIHEWSPSDHIEVPDLYSFLGTSSIQPLAYDDQPFSQRFRENI